MDNKFKKFASHTVAVVLGLLLASQCQGPKTSIVVKEVIKEVKSPPIVHHHVVTKEVVKWKTKVVKEYVSDPQYFVEIIRHYTLLTKKHRLSVYGGLGPKNLKTTALKGGYKVGIETAPILGVGYAYNLDRKYSIGFSVYSNDSFLFSVGRDF